MHIETPIRRDAAPDMQTAVQVKAAGARDRKRSGPRARANACLVSLVGTTLTGLLLHARLPHGDAWEAATASVGAKPGLQIVHVIFAAALVVSVAWHLVDKRRVLLTCIKRRSGRSLRSLLGNVALAGLLVASLLTGVVGDGRSQVAHHIAISSFLVVTCGWHGVRRMVRRRRATRRVTAGVGI